MATIVTRSGKGSPLTNTEVDANLTNLNTDKLEISGDTMTGNLNMGDNVKAIFGNGSDLSIYHDGSNSYIEDTAAGELILKSNGPSISFQKGDGTELFTVNTSGSSTLSYSGNPKLTTESSGVDITGNATFADNGKAIFGAGSDLQIYHDGSHSYVTDQGTGRLYLQGTSNVTFTNADGTVEYANFANGGAVSLRYNNGVKLATTSTGISVTGNATFADNGKAIFGAGSDLQIYHNPSVGSIIEDTGAGALFLRGSNSVQIETTAGVDMLLASEGGSVTAYYNGSPKLATTSTGIQVTGNIANASGDLTLDVAGDINLDAGGQQIFFQKGGTTFGQFGTESTPTNFTIESTVSDGDIVFKGNDGGSGITALTLDMSNAGAATFNSSITGSGPIQALAGNQLRAFTADDSAFIAITSNEIDVSSGNLTLDVAGNIILDANNVGIGTSLPVYPLVVKAANPRLQLLGTGTNTGISGLLFGDADTATRGQINYNHPSDSLDIVVNASEAMRILSDGSCRWTPDGSNPDMTLDASGNLLVGATSGTGLATGGGTNNGTNIVSGGGIHIQRNNDANIFLSKASGATNTSYIDFYSAGSTVGSIGTLGGVAYMNSGDVGFSLDWGSDQIKPRQANGANRDAAIDLGASASRFKDLHLSGSANASSIDVAYNLPDGTTSVIRPLKVRTTDTSNDTNLLTGSGVGILFEIADQTESSIGASIDAVKTVGTDANSSTDMVFRTSANNETLNEVMRLTSAGHVTMPYQPYFAAEMNGNANYTNTASQTALPFNTVVHNIGNHFNTSTYRFTAPITGKYLMAVGVIHNQSNPIGRIMFYLNGNGDGGNMKWGINGSNTAGGGSHTATSIIYMSAGDYVDVRSQSGTINSYKDNHSSWTGMLLG